MQNTLAGVSNHFYQELTEVAMQCLIEGDVDCNQQTNGCGVYLRVPSILTVVFIEGNIVYVQCSVGNHM